MWTMTRFAGKSMKCHIAVVAIALILNCCSCVDAEDRTNDIAAIESAKTPVDETAPPSAHDLQRIKAWRDAQAVQGPILAGVFVVCVLLIFIPPWRRGERMNSMHFKAYTLTLIIFAGLYLIVTGWSDNQLAPMMGLLGTLAGYILGERANVGPQKSAADLVAKDATPVGDASERN